jgi:hypothetical protein
LSDRTNKTERTFKPVRKVSTEDPHASLMDTPVHVHLSIERDEKVPVPVVVVGFDPQPAQDGADHIDVTGVNWSEDDKGAAAIASFLRVAADAIDEELGIKRSKEAHPARPRFNPRPVGAR